MQEALLALPTSAVDLPTAQLEQTELANTEAYLPAAQLEHAAPAEALNWPTMQAAQDELLVLPTKDVDVPERQLEQATLPRVAAYFPTGQPAHEVLPSSAEAEPTPQLTHETDAVEPGAEE